MEDEVTSYEMIAPNDAALSTYVKAEIDMQIATAKNFPRSLKIFLQKVESIATITESVAESCTYALPRKEKRGNTWETKYITGPSVRFAEIVVNSYGNIRSGARVIANDGRTITAQGMCHDLETNTLVVVEVKRRITNKEGRTFSEDMQVMTGNAACAIAFRNAVFKVVPSAIVEEVYEKVQEVAKGSAETLVSRREKAIKYFNGLGIKDDQITKKLQVAAIEDIGLDKLQILSGFKTSIKNNETTVEEIFAEEQDQKDKADKAADATADAIKKATSKAAAK